MFDHIASFILLYGQNEIIKEVEIGSQMLFLLRVFFYFMFAGITIYGIKKIQKRVHLDDVGTWLVTSLSLGLYIILCTIIFFANAEGNLLSTVLLNSFFITLYFTFTVVLLFITYFYMKKRSEDKYKEKEKQNLKEYTTYLESNYNELRKFRHDYQNILTSLESFIEEDDFDRLKDYYYQSIKKTQQLMQKNDFKLSEISRLEVTEIKSIVISKLLQSQWAGIDTELEVKDRINDVNMDSVSLIRCLGIILDNAIEETKENKEGFIRMAIIKEMESISFIVQNTIKTGHPKLFEMNRSGFSTKGENRGLGLSNLKEMIDPQMNVTLETLIDNDCFIQKIEITN
ncbi:GHKL domain-containing protein [Enterococcus sp. BWB1-3]|uniref:sensor histidine kinase n=1 Tax=unclassified Enterococcus TaxID=2608891 RepID=UPI001921F74C|nr:MULTISPECIES: GHKL domain-containing protein [unclassified Enterococcus]MBL1230214.1 GHKL domain-containing protein [Enterococcus sp. BWB1-3]MCB5953744.1 GHKL domain-containing protein [Enterococcus sp. CWB-B31]